VTKGGVNAGDARKELDATEEIASRRPCRKPQFIMIMLALLLAGGFCAYYALFFRAATRTPSAEGALKSRTPKITTSPSSSHSATPALAKTPRRAGPSPRAATRGAAAAPSAAVAFRLCGQAGWPETPVGGGAYIVQNDEWNSTAPECITTDGGAQFAIISSSIYRPTDGDPGGYPAIYSGCSAGVCTTGNKMPIRVSQLTPGTVTTSWATAQPRNGAYDVAYDIWFNHTPAMSGTPNGAELMIWLAHRGGADIAPAGRPVARAAIGGHAYTIWVWSGNRRGAPPSDRITYVMNRAATSVQDLDIGDIAADAARRGYIADTSYLVNIQAGFELWQGGGGLETKSFAVNVGR
jgi:hypothetical protein